MRSSPLWFCCLPLFLALSANSFAYDRQEYLSYFMNWEATHGVRLPIQLECKVRSDHSININESKMTPVSEGAVQKVLVNFEKGSIVWLLKDGDQLLGTIRNIVGPHLMIATAIDSEFETKFREEAIVGLFSRINNQIVFVDFYGSDSRNWGYDDDELVGFMASYSCDATDQTGAVNQTDVDKAFIKVFSDMFASQLDAPHTAMKDCWMKEFIGIAKDFPNNVKTALVKKAEGSNYEKPSDEELTEAQSVAMNLLANCAKSVVMDAYWIASAMTPNVVAFYNQHGRLPMTSEENNGLGCPSETDKCSGKDWTSVWSNRRGVHLAVGEDLESGVFQTYVYAKPRGGLRSLLFSGDITNSTEIVRLAKSAFKSVVLGYYRVENKKVKWYCYDWGKARRFQPQNCVYEN